MGETLYQAAIYARLSREDGDKAESNSIGSQKAICAEYIRQHPDLTLVKTYVDDGWSSVSFDRSNFKLTGQDIREGKSTVLLSVI